MYGELARINVAATLERKKKKRILMFKNRDGLVNEKIKERGEKNDSHEIPSRITRHIEFNLGLYTSRSAAAAARLTDGKKECHIISGGVEEEEKGETPNNKERGL